MVYGATGFTGREVARHLNVTQFPGLRWAVCGRDASKLAALQTELGLGPEVPVLVADTDSADSLHSAFSQAKIVLNCTGMHMHDQFNSHCSNIHTLWG